MKKYLKVYVTEKDATVEFIGGLSDLTDFLCDSMEAIIKKLPSSEREKLVKRLTLAMFLMLKKFEDDDDSDESDVSFENDDSMTLKEFFNAVSKEKAAKEFFDETGEPFTVYLYKEVNGKDEFVALYHNSDDEQQKYGSLQIDLSKDPDDDIFMYNPRGLKVYIKED